MENILTLLVFILYILIIVVESPASLGFMLIPSLLSAHGFVGALNCGKQFSDGSSQIVSIVKAAFLAVSVFLVQATLIGAFIAWLGLLPPTEPKYLFLLLLGTIQLTGHLSGCFHSKGVTQG